jgi:hypothetical protein
MLKIVSGGQTGADRAALDFAIENRIPHGGWCPQGRLAEDGMLDPRYKLKETTHPSYAQRTEWNVRDSDGTVILSISRELSGGSKLTQEFASRHKKPCLHLAQGPDDVTAASKLKEFIEAYKIQTLNVAGPRQSTEPTISNYTYRILQLCFGRAK